MEKTSEKVPKRMKATFEAVVALTDAFSEEHLTHEYGQLAREATAALSRKRPSPLSRGRPISWACGVMHALGAVNFLFDPAQTPHMSVGYLCENFGVSASTGASKSRAVREALDMVLMDPRWSLPSRLDANPMAWMIMVNGLVVDARMMPREVQEVAFEKGLIPYIPDHEP